MCTNPPAIDKFFTLYKKLLTQLSIESPMHIWNCDESRVEDVPKEEEVIGVTGEKIHTITPKEQGETTTILTSTNACGQVMPSLVIHKGSEMSDLCLLNKPASVTLCCSPKGWINKQVFFEYAQNWIRWLKTHEGLSTKRKHLLILGVHKSHIYNLQFLTLMTSNNIEVLAIPSHTSHILQPLDSTPFTSFKTALNANLSDYLF